MADFQSWTPPDPFTVAKGALGVQGQVLQNQATQQSIENAKLANQTGQFDLATKNRNASASALFGILANPNSTGKDALDAVDRGLQAGYISPTEAQQWRSRVRPEMTHADMAPLATSALVATLAGPEALKAIAPQNTQVQAGDRTVILQQPGAASQVAGAPGTPTAVGQVQHGISPGWISTGDQTIPTIGGAPAGPGIQHGLPPGSVVTYTKPDGSTGTSVGYTGRGGGQVGGAPGAPNPASVGPRGLPQIGGGGGYGSPGGGQATPAPAPAPGAPGAPQHFDVPANLKENQTAYQAALTNNPKLEDSVQALQRAQVALELSNSGPGTATVQKMYSFLNSQGLLPSGMTEKTANYDVLKKELNKYVMAQARAGGTNLQLETGEASSPNLTMSPQAARQEIQNAIGNTRTTIVGVNRIKNGGGSFPTDMNNHRGSVDTVAFQWDTMKPTEQAAYIKSLKGDPKDPKSPAGKFYRSLGIAAEHGYIGTPAPQKTSAAESLISPTQQVSNQQLASYLT